MNFLERRKAKFVRAPALRDGVQVERAHAARALCKQMFAVRRIRGTAPVRPGGTGRGQCGIPHMDFREYPFHSLG